MRFLMLGTLLLPIRPRTLPTAHSSISPSSTGRFSRKSNLIVYSAPPSGTAAPEPSTWMMLLAGFGGLGLVAYRPSPRSDGRHFGVTLSWPAQSLEPVHDRGRQPE